MISVQEAKNILSKEVTCLLPEKLPLQNAIGRYTAADIYSPIHVPSFDNSAMDGYAIIHNPETDKYRVISETAAGTPAAAALGPGQAVRIFTGAMVPQNADTVIKQEDVIRANDVIRCDILHIKKGGNIRKTGEQCRQGDLIVRERTQVNPGICGLLSSVGITEIEVFKLPEVCVIITGSELIAPGKALTEGKIYNSNQSIIESYLTALGITKAAFYQAGDNISALREVVSDALASCDVLLLTGGISVGDYDFVYQVLEENGVTPLFYKLRQKPGKPLYAGKRNKKLIFALPGNPASVTSCMNQYVKPSLRKMTGAPQPFAPSARLPLSHSYKKKTPFANILKAKAENGMVSITDGQASFNMAAFARANAFVLLYEEDIAIEKDDLVEVYYW